MKSLLQSTLVSYQLSKILFQNQYTVRKCSLALRTKFLLFLFLNFNAEIHFITMVIDLMLCFTQCFFFLFSSQDGDKSSEEAEEEGS